MINVRKTTCAIIEAMEEGVLDPMHVARACLNYMSEAAVEDMNQTNEILQNFCECGIEIEHGENMCYDCDCFAEEIEEEELYCLYEIETGKTVYIDDVEYIVGKGRGVERSMWNKETNKEEFLSIYSGVEYDEDQS